MTTTLITGGTVVSATGRAVADVLVDGETIRAVLEPGSTLLGTDVAASVDRVIDATGKYVIPGGIDAHTHMQLPFGGTEASDTFETGTRAAAWGGTTSIIDFAVQTYGQRVEDGLAAWHEKAAGNCAIDYGFHQIVGDVNDASLEAMRRLPDEGISSFKLFMAYPGVFYSDDAQILKAMQVSRDTGMLTMMHAENGPAIDVLAQQLVDQGKTDPFYHGIARAWEMEEEATHRAIMLAKLTGAPLYVVHVSAKQAVEQLAWARDKGQNVYGETCPQYLYLSLEDQLGAKSDQWGAFEGAKWVCSTPLRSREEGHQDSMWRALRTNDLQMVSTDHCPFCMKDQKELGLVRLPEDPQRHRLDRAPHGPHVPGRRHRRDHPRALGGAHEHDAGPHVRPRRQEGRDPARRRRGHRGLRPERPHVDRHSRRRHHMNMDYSAWEGYEIDGHVDTVLSRGKVIVDGDEYLGAKGDGRFLKRGLSTYLV